MNELSVLVVDDEEAFVEALARRLDKRGFRVATATSGQDALGALNDMATRQTLLTVDNKEVRLLAPSDDGATEKKWLKEAEEAYERFVDVKPFWKA